MSENLTQTFARFASELQCEDIPATARERCKDLLLDAMACALAGYEGEDAPKVSRFAAALGQSHESSVIGSGRLSLTGAAALNGFLITSVSLCDVYRPTATHLQPVVIPPALAIAERENASGRDLLTALAAGSSGATPDLNRPTTVPSLPIRNFSKFQATSPFGSADSVRVL